jgi:hypothetical protein
MSHDIETRQLLIDQALSGAVQGHIRDVIKAAAHTVGRLRPTPEGISGMRESQLRNVVNVALGAQSVTALAGIIVRMFADDVQGPLPFMNKDTKP